VNELDMSVTAFAWDGDSGVLEPVETATALPAELREVPNKASEVAVHPSGMFLYNANRGHDSISVFRIRDDGKLERVEIEPVRGAYPRHFALDAKGRWLLAAGKDTSSVAVFRVDESTGKLTFTARVISVPQPICVVIDG
jgi:6-phosphogluconolactonase